VRTGQRKRQVAAMRPGSPPAQGIRRAGRPAGRAPASWPGAPPRAAPPPRTPGPCAGAQAGAAQDRRPGAALAVRLTRGQQCSLPLAGVRAQCALERAPERVRTWCGRWSSRPAPTRRPSSAPPHSCTRSAARRPPPPAGARRPGAPSWRAASPRPPLAAPRHRRAPARLKRFLDGVPRSTPAACCHVAQPVGLFKVPDTCLPAEPAALADTRRRATQLPGLNRNAAVPADQSLAQSAVVSAGTPGSWLLHERVSLRQPADRWAACAACTRAGLLRDLEPSTACVLFVCPGRRLECNWCRRP